MNKGLKLLLKNLKELYTSVNIKKMALNTKFMKRESKITPEIFLSLCLFSGEDLCKSTLLELRTRLDNNEDITVSPQAIDQRFNTESVQFLKKVFQGMLEKQNKILKEASTLLKTYFKSIKVVDSTTINLPEHLKSTYRGSGGSASDAALKVQLEYELFTGNFIHCDIVEGVSTDADYLPTLERGIEANDLHLKDLGYFKADHFKYIEECGSYYLSKIKSTTAIYVKNDNPEILSNGKFRKSSLYKKIDIEAIVRPLSEGETIELFDIYIGTIHKFKTRLIVTKLTEENKRKRKIKFLKDIKKKKKKASNENIFWYTINIYVTNISDEIVDKEQLHDIYSLRWQMELMFKIWKSTFKIHDIKKVKLERVQCFLYARLTALLLTSSIVSTGKKINSKENGKAISEIKSFAIVKGFFRKIRENIFKGELVLFKLLNRIITSILKYGKKSTKKGGKCTYSILKGVKIYEVELENIAI
ncbi:IS4 family transposase [Clostridium sp.]|uniref:IS4 family transposase n=1 Tax=Clostridium sp. TaxID=1506 RepID=UPI003FD8A17C